MAIVIIVSGISFRAGMYFSDEQSLESLELLTAEEIFNAIINASVSMLLWHEPGQNWIKYSIYIYSDLGLHDMEVGFEWSISTKFSVTVYLDEYVSDPPTFQVKNTTLDVVFKKSFPIFKISDTLFFQHYYGLDEDGWGMVGLYFTNWYII